MVELNKYKKIYSDGDLDGFTATSILVENLGIRDIVFPHPAKRRGLVIKDAISVELSPSMGVQLQNAVLFDHHEFKGVYHFEDNEHYKALEEMDGRSVAEIVAKYLGVEVPSDIMEFVNKVDSDPKSVADDPRYIGYRALLTDPTWRELARDGIQGVYRALELFAKVGSRVVSVLREADKYIGIATVWEEPLVAVVYPKEILVQEHSLGDKKILVDITSVILRQKMMELEGEYDIVAMITPRGDATGVSIWANTSKGYRANEIAEKLGKVFGGTGGGRDKIAGAQIPLPYSTETLGRIIKTLQDIVRK